MAVLVVGIAFAAGDAPPAMRRSNEMSSARRLWRRERGMGDVLKSVRLRA